MDFLINAISFWAFFAIYTFILSNIIFPLFYSIPVSLSAFVKKEIYFKGVLVSLIPVTIWSCVLVGAAVMLGYACGKLNQEWLYTVLFGYGQNLSFWFVCVILFGKIILEKYRYDIREEYFTRTYCKYLKPEKEAYYNYVLSTMLTAPYDDVTNIYFGLENEGKFEQIIIRNAFKKRLQEREDELISAQEESTQRVANENPDD